MPRRRATRRKRRTRKSSGGGDKKPQFLNATGNFASTTNWATTIAEIPLLNILTGGTKVIEVLKVQISKYQGTSTLHYAIGSRNLNSVSLGTYSIESSFTDKAFMIAGQMGSSEAYREIDLTDENGNGQLYPAQQFFINGVAGSANQGFKFSFLYRIKNASMMEYIGIINQYVVTQS